jgi:hypothetical protein
VCIRAHSLQLAMCYNEMCIHTLAAAVAHTQAAHVTATALILELSVSAE